MNPAKRQVNNFLQNVNVYEEENQDVLTQYYFGNDPLKGHATEEGTDTYYRRSQSGETNLEVHPDNFKSPYNSNLKISSIGYGSYVGDSSDFTDWTMYEAIKTSVLSGGVNNIDTAPNYRYMKSEKTIGRALQTLEEKYGISRKEIFVSSKVGYLPEDAENLISRNDLMTTLINDIGVPETEIVKESMHSLHPRFIKHQLEASLDRLKLECLDLYYLQNAYEAQGPYNTDNVFFDRLTKAFETMEQLVE